MTAGAVPSLRVRTTTEWAAASVAGSLSGGPDKAPTTTAATGGRPVRAVEVLALDPGEARPSGPRFGSLVHGALSIVPLDAGRGAIDAVIGTQARVLGATAEETLCAGDLVDAVLRHPLFDDVRAAARSDRCLREAPVTLTIGDELVEGTVDLAFESGGCITVIDFKTDRVEDGRLAQYQRQVGLYADAIAKVTNGPVRAILMMI